MARKLLFILTTSLICILPAFQANAGTGLLGAAARFSWNNYNKPVLLHGQNHAETTGLIDSSGFGGPTFGGELQVRPIERLSIGLGIDMGITKHTVYPNTGAGDIESSATFFKFGFLLGVKFYVIPPEVKKAALYLHLAGGKYIAKASNDIVDNPEYPAPDYLVLDAQLEVASGLNSPVVIQFAVGAEFFAAEAFSIGADILGIKLGISSASVGNVLEAGPYSGDHKLFTMSVYSALTLNFGFGSRKDKGGAASENEGDAWGSAGGAGDAGASGGDQANDGWGNSGAAGGAATNDGWDAQPAGSGGGAAAEGGWEAQPAGGGASDGGDGGWEAQPAPAPADNGGSGGGGAKPKAKAKPKSSSPSTPPPPPPGY